MRASCRGTASYESDVELHSLVPLPRNPEQILVAGVRTNSDHNAVLAVVDSVTNRFLPGMLEVGTGAIDDMRVDEQGRVWMTLPWSGEIVRATPH